MPAFVLGLTSAGGTLRFVRNSLLDILGQDYVRTARAKGLPEARVIGLHALRNALVPLLQLLGLSLPSLLSGALVTEVVFSWPGIGQVTLQAIFARDFPDHPRHHHSGGGTGDRRHSRRRPRPRRRRSPGAPLMKDPPPVPPTPVPPPRSPPPPSDRALLAPLGLAPGWIGRRLRSNPLLVFGALLVGLLAFVALAAPWLAGADPSTQFDPVAGRYLPPGSERVPLIFADGRRLLAEHAARSGDRMVAQRLGRRESYPAAELVDLPAHGVPAAQRFPLGSDRFGRDVWSRLIYGARVSLAVALLAVLLATLIGTAVGAAAAMTAEWIDTVLMRLVDALLAVPRLFLLLALVALFSPSTASLVVIIALTSWMTVARLVRAELLSLREREFVVAARALGAHPLRILAVHLLPNALTTLLVLSGLLIGAVILLESALSFLGLGIQPPTPSWGNMIGEGADRLLAAWWVPTFAGLAIVLTVVAFNLLADGLRDALDPRH